LCQDGGIQALTTVSESRITLCEYLFNIYPSTLQDDRAIDFTTRQGRTTIDMESISAILFHEFLHYNYNNQSKLIVILSI